MEPLSFVESHLTAIVATVSVLGLLLLHRFFLKLLGVWVVPEDSVGIVTKKFVLFGNNKSLPDGSVVALKGEAGIQADTLAPGLHFGLWPWQYEIDIQKFITIPQGTLGVVSARDGKALTGGRNLGRTIECDSFQNARAFLEGGGERGPQLAIIPPGTYRINTGLFTIESARITEISENAVGVITTKEGAALETGSIAGKEVSGHNMYQNAQKFLDAGGGKGLQEQVILAGRYYINPIFATVEEVPMTEIPLAHAGCVIAFVGKEGVDVTGDSFKHGNLVSKGERGVWAEPLDPGRYPINPYTHKVESVPTANIVLNWATGKNESHNLDKNLSTITVRSNDGFTFNLDVSQIIHVPRTEAPKVIARFGNIANLVTQVLEPTIGNYFRNAAQGSDVIKFLGERTARQSEAKKAIATALNEYNVMAVDTLIGDITPPNELMKTLTDRKLAQEEQATFETQKFAEEKRKEFEQAKAMAATQARVVDAERQVTIADFAAQTAVKKAGGDAESKTINAKADAAVVSLMGDAEAGKIRAVGTAEAEVVKAKADAVDQQNYALIEVSRALSTSGFPLVPSIIAGASDNNGSSGGLVNVLMASLLKDQLVKAPVNDVAKKVD